MTAAHEGDDYLNITGHQPYSPAALLMQGMENAIMQITLRSRAFDRGINADGVGGEEALSNKWPEDKSLNGERR